MNEKHGREAFPHRETSDRGPDAPHEREAREKRPRHRSLIGRHPMTLGAIGLHNLSDYELWIRLETFIAWFKGLRHLSSVRGTSFLEDMIIVFETPELRLSTLTMLFQLACAVFGLVCIIRRDRARGAWVLFGIAAALAGAGFALGTYSFFGTAQLLKLIPLALIMVGCVVNRAQRRFRRGR